MKGTVEKGRLQWWREELERERSRECRMRYVHSPEWMVCNCIILLLYIPHGFKLKISEIYVLVFYTYVSNSVIPSVW